MNSKHLNRGMTLIELLVGLAIVGLFLMLMSDFFVKNSTVSVRNNVRNEMQQDTLIAQQLITGRLREAFYIVPPSQTIELSASAGSTYATYRNPTPNRYGKSTWLVGTDPILAMVLPPADTTQPCTLTNSSTPATPINDGCYRFYAYYPVNRLVWTEETTNSNDPGADAVNANAWVLVQYMGYLSNDFSSAAETITSSIPNLAVYINYKTSSAQLLSDYIEPTISDGTTTGLTTPTTTYTMFSFANSSGKPISLAYPVDTVTINLASARLIGGQLMRLPDNTNEYSIVVNTSNQGKIAVGN